MRQQVGIIGAGQLGAYLCRAARVLDIRTTVVYEQDDDVALAFADETVKLDPHDLGTMEALIEKCDVITFEKEAIPAPVLDLLEQAELNNQVSVAPSVSTMRLLQSKARQKHWLVEQGFPTAQHLQSRPGLTRADIIETLGTPFVMKSSHGGYDGLGVKVVANDADITFLQSKPYVAERYIDNRIELGVIVARNYQNDLVDYPVVEMSFDTSGNVLRHVVCPAQVGTAIKTRAQALARDVIERLGGIGIFAVELFLDQEQLLINEISPRVHNAGHLTIEAQPTSQFEQHLRAITKRSFGHIKTDAVGAMVNMLSTKPSGTRQPAQVLPGCDKVAHIHWYGKTAPRALRKMGHITSVASGTNEALALAQQSLQMVEKSLA